MYVRGAERGSAIDMSDNDMSPSPSTPLPLPICRVSKVTGKRPSDIYVVFVMFFFCSSLTLREVIFDMYISNVNEAFCFANVSMVEILCIEISFVLLFVVILDVV